MKKFLNHFHKAFENRVRLGVMSALMVNENLEFNALKDLLQVTDGNLASHLKALEKENFVTVEKSFIGRKPNTRYSATAAGRKAFDEHLSALEQILKDQNRTI